VYVFSGEFLASLLLSCGSAHARVQAVKEKLVNFALFKAVFAISVLGDQLHEEIFVWVTWFSVVGLLNVIAFLCRMRADVVRGAELNRLLLSVSIQNCQWSRSCVVVGCLAVLVELRVQGEARPLGCADGAVLASQSGPRRILGSRLG
jgi:hypothetical protein